MSLTTRQRSSIYQKLLPILGEEDADAMIAQYPASEHDQLVTREHLRAELALLRGELTGQLTGEIGSLRSELNSEIGSLRSEMHEQFGSVRAEMHEQFGALRGEMHQLINRNTAAMTTLLLAAMGLIAAFD